MITLQYSGASRRPGALLDPRGAPQRPWRDRLRFGGLFAMDSAFREDREEDSLRWVEGLGRARELPEVRIVPSRWGRGADPLPVHAVSPPRPGPTATTRCTGCC